MAGEMCFFMGQQLKQNKEKRQLVVRVTGIIGPEDIIAYVNDRHHCKLSVGENICAFESCEFRFFISIDNLVPKRLGVVGECISSNEITVSNNVRTILVSISEENVPVVSIILNDQSKNKN